MRRNFAQVLKEGKVDLKREYSKLFNLFYGKDHRDGKSLADLVSMNFEECYFRGTCLDLDEFNQVHGFHFEEQPRNFSTDYLVSFCEYIYNFILHFEDRYFFSMLNKSFYLQQIDKVIEAIGYSHCPEDGFTIFVPKDNAAIAVSESKQIPATFSYKIIAYNHHTMRGNLESKRQTLLTFADLLESKRSELEAVDKKYASDLFYSFNSFNIRHNNTDPASPKYKKPVGDLSTEQLESWYDEVYQMCLLAFLRLEHVPRKQEFDMLKDKIENKK